MDAPYFEGEERNELAHTPLARENKRTHSLSMKQTPLPCHLHPSRRETFVTHQDQTFPRSTAVADASRTSRHTITPIPSELRVMKASRENYSQTSPCRLLSSRGYNPGGVRYGAGEEKYSV